MIFLNSKFLFFSSILSAVQKIFCWCVICFLHGISYPSFSHLCREKLNSMNLLLYMSPIAVLVLLPAALIMEPNVLDATISLGKEHKFMWMLLLVNSAMAYSANLSNFLVTKHTSPLTLQVQHLWLLFSLSVNK